MNGCIIQHTKSQRIIFERRLKDHLDVNSIQLMLGNFLYARLNSLAQGAGNRLDDGAARGQRGEASVIAAKTKRPILIDGHVTKLARTPTRPAVRFAVNENAGSDAHAD